MMVPWNWRAR